MLPEISQTSSDVGMGEESSRPKRRPPVSSAKRPWLAEELALLGKVTDRQAAEQLNRTRCSTASQRCAMGIPRLPAETLWAKDELDLLGTVPDEEAARRLGRSVRAVQRKRAALGRLAPGPPKAHWGEEELRLLGKVTDEEAARLTHKEGHEQD